MLMQPGNRPLWFNNSFTLSGFVLLAFQAIACNFCCCHI
uniref:Uncharacterized protein n=1 Tax=Arundo donax TaxID=35708 RepID=A0A0A8XXD9_ARUDO